MNYENIVRTIDIWHTKICFSFSLVSWRALKLTNSIYHFPLSNSLIVASQLIVPYPSGYISILVWSHSACNDLVALVLSLTYRMNYRFVAATTTSKGGFRLIEDCHSCLDLHWNTFHFSLSLKYVIVYLKNPRKHQLFKWLTSRQQFHPMQIEVLAYQYSARL